MMGHSKHEFNTERAFCIFLSTMKDRSTSMKAMPFPPGSEEAASSKQPATRGSMTEKYG